MKKTKILAIAAAGAMLVTGCTSGALKKTAMTIGDTTVTTGDISVMASSLLSYGYDFETAKTQMADQIEDTLKYGALGEAMGIELPEDTDKNVTQMKAQYAQMGGGLSAYKDFLKKSGSSMEFLETLFTASAYQSEVMNKINEELGDAEPTDDELKAYFKENFYRAKHILVEDAAEATEAPADGEATDATEAPAETPKSDKQGEELANELLAKAEAGEDFDALIKDFSTDPGSESNPDGYVFKDGDMVQEFTDCVKGLEAGKFGIAKSDYGYHVIQRLPLSEDDAKFAELFEANKEAVKSAYEQKKVDDKFNELCEQNNIKVEVNEDVIAGFEEKDMVTPEPTTDNALTAQ